VLFGLSGSFKVAGVLLVCVPLIPGAIVMVQKIAKKILAKYWDQYAKLGSTFLENLQGMTTLKTYRADAYKNNQMNEESENFRRITMKVLTMQLNSIIIMDFFAYGGAALGIALACKGFIEGSITLQSTVFMILLSADFFLPMRKLGSYFHVAMNGMAASDRIFKFLNEPEPEVKKEVLPESGLDIRLSDITFAYDDKNVLENVSLDIKDGTFTGIVGESGSGKSTIASLIMGRNSIKNGNLTIAGKSISEINEESLFKTINYVGLGSTFFKGTVRDNLLIAKPDADDDELWKSLSECNLDGFLKSEKGLDTNLTENAGNLSGGQKQRLALARAILHDAKIYIFDEATSNIDIESEEIILQKIKELSKTKTVIMITHRLMNVKDADSICCLENGQVKGVGTHDELLSCCETYKNLWSTQKALEEFGKGGAAL
jgi:ABC-type transport system involved in cytochrome bd biosynthesis fused ATPase/permease subunit